MVQPMRRGAASTNNKRKTLRSSSSSPATTSEQQDGSSSSNNNTKKNAAKKQPIRNKNVEDDVKDDMENVIASEDDAVKADEDDDDDDLPLIQHKDVQMKKKQAVAGSNSSTSANNNKAKTTKASTGTSATSVKELSTAKPSDAQQGQRRSSRRTATTKASTTRASDAKKKDGSTTVKSNKKVPSGNLKSDTDLENDSEHRITGKNDETNESNSSDANDESDMNIVKGEDDLDSALFPKDEPIPSSSLSSRRSNTRSTRTVGEEVAKTSSDKKTVPNEKNIKEDATNNDKNTSSSTFQPTNVRMTRRSSMSSTATSVSSGSVNPAPSIRTRSRTPPLRGQKISNTTKTTTTMAAEKNTSKENNIDDGDKEVPPHLLLEDATFAEASSAQNESRDIGSNDNLPEFFDDTKSNDVEHKSELFNNEEKMKVKDLVVTSSLSKEVLGSTNIHATDDAVEALVMLHRQSTRSNTVHTTDVDVLVQDHMPVKEAEKTSAKNEIDTSTNNSADDQLPVGNDDRNLGNSIDAIEINHGDEINIGIRKTISLTVRDSGEVEDGTMYKEHGLQTGKAVESSTTCAVNDKAKRQTNTNQTKEDDLSKDPSIRVMDTKIIADEISQKDVIPENVMADQIDCNAMDETSNDPCESTEEPIIADMKDNVSVDEISSLDAVTENAKHDHMATSLEIADVSSDGNTVVATDCIQQSTEKPMDTSTSGDIRIAKAITIQLPPKGDVIGDADVSPALHSTNSSPLMLSTSEEKITDCVDPAPTTLNVNDEVSEASIAPVAATAEEKSKIDVIEEGTSPPNLSNEVQARIGNSEESSLLANSINSTDNSQVVDPSSACNALAKEVKIGLKEDTETSPGTEENSTSIVSQEVLVSSAYPIILDESPTCTLKNQSPLDMVAEESTQNDTEADTGMHTGNDTILSTTVKTLLSQREDSNTLETVPQTSAKDTDSLLAKKLTTHGQGAISVDDSHKIQNESRDNIARKRTILNEPDLFRKRLRAMPQQLDRFDTVRIQRPNLSKIKLLLYTAGKLVHHKSTLTYDRLFSDYWTAFTRRLEGSLMASEMKKNQSVLISFLRTKSLRKIHNRLILGLMERCVSTTIPADDISHIPSDMRERIDVVSQNSTWRKRTLLDDTRSSEDSIMDTPSKKSRLQDLSYSKYTAMIGGPSAVLSERQQHSTAAPSSRISGALCIDPYVRKLAESHGLKMTEHAIWLLTVAVKEFTSSFLKKALSTKNAVSAGRVPPQLTQSFDISGTSNSGNKEIFGTVNQTKKVIQPSDLHTIIANLPISSRSLSGTVSRTVYERSLGSFVNDSMVLGGGSFEDLKSYIISSITPVEQKRLQVDTNVVVPPLQVLRSGHTNVTLPANAPKDRQTLPSRGLGRGAKDLASLKARSTSFTAKGDVDLSKESIPQALQSVPATTQASDSDIVRYGTMPMAQPQTLTIQASPLAHRNANSQSNINASLAEDASQGGNVNTQAGQEKVELERISGSSESSETRINMMRRGKGHGVKNLAAMRARSVTSSTDPDISALAVEGAMSESNTVDATVNDEGLPTGSVNTIDLKVDNEVLSPTDLPLKASVSMTLNNKKSEVLSTPPTDLQAPHKADTDASKEAIKDSSDAGLKNGNPQLLSNAKESVPSVASGTTDASHLTNAEISDASNTHVSPLDTQLQESSILSIDDAATSTAICIIEKSNVTMTDASAASVVSRNEFVEANSTNVSAAPIRITENTDVTKVSDKQGAADANNIPTESNTDIIMEDSSKIVNIQSRTDTDNDPKTDGEIRKAAAAGKMQDAISSSNTTSTDAKQQQGENESTK